MKLRDFLVVVNYNEFDICIETKNDGLKRIFKITKDTPIQYISEELLNSEVLNVFVNDEEQLEDEFLFTIVVYI